MSTREEKIDKIMKYLCAAIDVASDMIQMDEPILVKAMIVSVAKEATTEAMREIANKMYTDDDLSNIIEFYESETGQKSLEVSKSIMSTKFQDKVRSNMQVKIEKIFTEMARKEE